MSNVSCDFEDDLLDALQRGFIGSELNAHIDHCPSCSELRLVAGELLDDRGHAMATAPIPTSAAMWWRMLVRRRQDAERSSRQALLIGQAATLAIAIVLTVAIFGVDLAAGIRDVIASIRLSTPILIGVVSWLFLAPIGGYVAMRQK